MECRRRGGWLRDYAGTAGTAGTWARACVFLLATNATLSRWQASGRASRHATVRECECECERASLCLCHED
jgi:hypothetical protein